MRSTQNGSGIGQKLVPLLGRFVAVGGGAGISAQKGGIDWKDARVWDRNRVGYISHH